MTAIELMCWSGRLLRTDAQTKRRANESARLTSVDFTTRNLFHRVGNQTCMFHHVPILPSLAVVCAQCTANGLIQCLILVFACSAHVGAPWCTTFCFSRTLGLRTRLLYRISYRLCVFCSYSVKSGYLLLLSTLACFA